ncbi:MAG: FG-GAP-like repeat-containing protein [Actinomycetota bacterium]|nr:FG-GAP-like repeat-containing protein [Actinomycetota bacterium]
MIGFHDGFGVTSTRFSAISASDPHNAARESTRRRRSVGRLLALGAATCALLAAWAPSSFAATPSTPYDTVGVNSPDTGQSEELFGQRIEDADLGSGVRDLFASSYQADFSSHDQNLPDAGQVTLFNGRDRSMRYEIFSPEPQVNGQFGFYMSDIGDVNGNGKEDLAVGAPAEDVNATTGIGCTVGTPGCNENQGKMFVYEGATGALLYAVNSPSPQSHPGTSFRGFGARIGAAGDVNRDGTPDIIVGASSYDAPAGCSTVVPLPADCHKAEGEAYIFSGKNGAPIRTLNLPAADRPAATCSNPGSTVSCGNFGGTVQGPGDVNGDGFPDQFVSAYALRPDPDHHGRVYLFSGKDGTVLTRIVAPETGASQFFGLQDASPNTPGDVNGDGAADIYINAFTQSGTGGNSQGKAWIFDGKASAAAGTGVLLYEVKDPSPTAAESFGFVASRTDYDKDGVPDLLTGGIGGNDREIYVNNGRDGSPLKTLRLSDADFQPNVPGNSGSELGTGARALGDINGDCEPDYAAGAAYQDVAGAQNQGKVFFFLSRGSCPVGPGPSGSLTSTGMTGGFDTSAPGVSSYGLTNNPFTVGGSTPTFGTAAAKKKGKRHKKGTTFRYTLSEAGTVKVTIAQRLAGRRKGKRCVAPTRKLRKARKCTRVLNRGTLTRVSHVGKNSVAFSGRIGSRKLSPGSYLATIIATDAAKNSSTPRTISFTIVKR